MALLIPCLAAWLAGAMLTRDVARGAVLTADDLADGDAAGPVTVAAATGMEAVRPLPAGTMLRPADLTRPTLVRRGAAVTIILRAPGMEITTPGRGLSNGAAGDAVRVVATTTSRTLDAVVEGPGRVAINGN